MAVLKHRSCALQWPHMSKKWWVVENLNVQCHTHSHPTVSTTTQLAWPKWMFESDIPCPCAYCIFHIEINLERKHHDTRGYWIMSQRYCFKYVHRNKTQPFGICNIISYFCSQNYLMLKNMMTGKRILRNIFKHFSNCKHIYNTLGFRVCSTMGTLTRILFKNITNIRLFDTCLVIYTCS